MIVVLPQQQKQFQIVNQQIQFHRLILIQTIVVMVWKQRLIMTHIDIKHEYVTFKQTIFIFFFSLS
jgi:hypothetical protein